ncbi:MAG TPA: phosphoenolpyruvate--protein phosphotransferase [Pyrinomonadaceae bacterium]|nr:phosphoenolpyruvate--protein phosphotransferase [Pyrinomonadaceae bacterium]
MATLEIATTKQIPDSTKALRRASGRIQLIAPLSGHLLPIEAVSDPVFAQKMVGGGVSLDPVSQSLVSPCDGTVTQIHSAGHAVTITTMEGVEVLMHIGLDTVMLKGEGFTPRVKTGETVARGDVLIDFDADYVATHARSLLTEIVVTNMGLVRDLHTHAGDVLAGQDPILDITFERAIDAGDNVGETVVTSPAILIANPAGLHARPAAVLANAAKKFGADIRLRRGERQANAKSVVAILGMEVGHGDQVVLLAQGSDAGEAVRVLAPMIESGLNEEVSTPAPIPIAAAKAEPVRQPDSGDPNVLNGVAASPGLAVGNIFQLRREEMLIVENAADPSEEQRRLEGAIAKARNQLEALQTKLQKQSDGPKAAIFEAHAELLDDPDLHSIANSLIAKGKSAAFAWREAVETHARVLESLNNELFVARAGDLRDVGRRVIDSLADGARGTLPEVPPDTILIAEDLSPSDTAGLDRSRVRGFCTTLGGATSHVAILARSLDIPAVAGIDPLILNLPNGTPVILDGTKGTITLAPNEAEIKRIRERQQRQSAHRAAALETAHEPATTIDGKRIEVVANIGGPSDAEQVVQLGGEGVGLLRSEFLFMKRAQAPTEQEQFEAYSTIARTLGPARPLIIRTLDVGGDKPLSYLPIPPEANPFLGERGIRVGLNRPDMLRTQLRAILRASAHGSVRIMFPMIATLAELREARKLLAEEQERLGVGPIEVGIMIEIPAAALMAQQFAREVDFFSVGSNDLTQYTLAMDRGHPKLAPKIDALSPSVLQLIAMTTRAAEQEGKWVGVCGGIASDLQALPLLIGLGVAELSVSVPTIPSIKAQIRTLDMTECKRLAQQALELESATEVRALCPQMDE